MRKRGLSTIVTTLILILLVFVAIGIVWGVVKNVLNEGKENINMNFITSNFEIQKVKILEHGLNVSVKRDSGEGEMGGLRFIISNGVNSNTTDWEGNISEFQTITLPLQYDGIVKKISVAPFVKTKKGKLKLGNIQDSLEFSDEEVIENFPGIVSWWSFDGSGQDLVGGNYATMIGSLDYVDSKFGKAVNLSDGSTNYFYVESQDNSLNITKNLSIEAWIKPESNFSMLLDKIHSGETYLIGFFDDPNPAEKKVQAKFKTRIGNFNSEIGKIKENEWNHVVITYSSNSGNISFYKNGVLNNSFLHSYPGELNSTNGTLWIGQYTSGSALLDDLRIYNTTLTPNQVAGLYHLNPSV